jgi:hypothetical protein
MQGNCETISVCKYSVGTGPAFAHGTTGAKRTVGMHKNFHKKKKAKLCNIVTATSLLN